MGLCWTSFKNYIEDFKMPWYDGWQAHSKIRFNRYDSNTQMRLHCDHIHTLFDGKDKGIPIMTSLGILNDDYTGGEFMMFGDLKLDLKAGDIVVFPSNFLYPHKVNPVLSGVRYSFVSWAW
jgi:predicted 2-oxoglutarate/Fe(II)-dependent dioxygenase YbiX